MALEKEIQQEKPFDNEAEKVLVNVMYTANYIKNQMAIFLKKYDLTGGAKITEEARSSEDDQSLVGYIITSVNGKKVENADDAARRIDVLAKRGYRLSIEMINLEGEVERFVFRY